ncbi:MAG: hypothetical protein LBM93_09185 [Oscillospiraceae bacterium]|jgi:hypothetical protein|nr:hypothetical protein [Oscillospiraceae bacterium]
MKDYALDVRKDATTTDRAVLNDFLELHGFFSSRRTASCARHVKHLAKGYKDFNLEEKMKSEPAKEESPLEEAAAEYSNSSEESPDKAQEAHEEAKAETKKKTINSKI